VKDLKRLIFWASLVAAAAAVAQELRRPPEQRTWHGLVFGFVPYDFRPPSLRRFKDAWWDAENPRLLTPRDFGVGWAINLPRAFDLIAAYRRREDDEGSEGRTI
jgi:hypothetical protein